MNNLTNKTLTTTTLSPTIPLPSSTPQQKPYLGILQSLISKLTQAIISLNTTASSTSTSPTTPVDKPTIPSTPALFQYFLSPYAAACMFLAVVLNRTVVYAQARDAMNLRANANQRRKGSVSTKALCLALRFGIIYLLCDKLRQCFQIHNEAIAAAGGPGNKEVDVPSFLWHVFLVLGSSQFLETLIASTKGVQAGHDSGLTLFEQSLAFHEVQYYHINTPILVIVGVSLLNQIIIHSLAVCKLTKYHFWPSCVVSLGFLGYYVRSIVDGEIAEFPGVVIVSVIPQLLVLGVSFICLVVYGLAILLANGKTNLVCSSLFDNIWGTLNFRWEDDFNSMLMKLGYVVFSGVKMENQESVSQRRDVVWQEATYLDHEDSVRKNAYFIEFKDDPDHKLQNDNKNSDSDSFFIAGNWILINKFLNLFNLSRGLVLLVPKIYTLAMEKRNKKEQQQQYKHAHSVNNPSGNATAADQEELDEDYIQSEGEEQLLSDSDSEEYDSDYTSETEQPESNKLSPLEELYSTPTQILSLLQPITPEQIILNQTIQTHLHSAKRLTRSKFNQLDKDGPLQSLILEKRPHQQQHHQSSSQNNNHEDIQDQERDLACAICLTSPRTILIWPCRCLAICEGCRLGLGVRGFEKCCCCRRDAEGFSRIYLP